MKSFYEYMIRYQNIHHFCDEVANLANMIHHDQNFPKQARDFQTLSDYMEWNSEYQAYIDVFDRAYQEYQDSL